MKGDILYECDPVKNIECTKTSCALIVNNELGDCTLTLNPKYAKEGGAKWISTGRASENGLEELLPYTEEVPNAHN